MPNRLIKDSIYESEKINDLTDFQFRVWVALIAYVDDFGRGDARPAIIKGRCFPLRRSVTEDDVMVALYDLQAAGCIQMYSVCGKSYLCFPTWSKHQSIRNQRSKYPSPDDADADRLQQIDGNCKQLKSTACKCPRNPIQSNPTTESNKESKEDEEERAREGQIDMNAPWYRFVWEYERNIGMLPTTDVERGDIQMFFDEFGVDVLKEVIAYTARNHPNNPHVFFAKICRDWLGKGITTADQAKAAIKDHERQAKGGRNGKGNGGAGSGDGQELRYGTVL